MQRKNLRTQSLPLLAWLALATLLIAAVPLFLCQHLPNDAAYYDVQARCVLEGGTLYKDAVEPNLPGIVWVHMAIRSVFGWSTVTLRLFDLVFLAGTSSLLVRWNRADRSQPYGLQTPLLVLAVFWMHFCLTEWCHCQRDGWMLLPGLAALSLRDRNLRDTNLKTALPSLWGYSLFEGMLWGTAFWLKPHIAFPALFALLASCLWAGLSRRLLTSVSGVVCGGLLMGALGAAWLIQSGTWPHFWEMLLEWNPEYVAARSQRISLSWYLVFFEVFSPWTWAHLIAVPLAILVIYRQLFSSLKRHAQADNGTTDPSSPEITKHRRDLLMSAFFIGWLLQAVAIQYPFAYVQTPAIVLAIGLCTGIRWRADLFPVARLGYGFVFLVALLGSPCTEPARLANWLDCVTQGPTASVRANVQYETIPSWHDLPAIINFLKERNVHGTDVLVFDAGLVTIFNEMDLRPPNRYVYTDVHARLFKSHADNIHDTVEHSPHRFVVSSLIPMKLTPEQIEDINPQTNLPRAMGPELLDKFPYNQPVIFRQGVYIVHRAVHPIGELYTSRAP